MVSRLRAAARKVHSQLPSSDGENSEGGEFSGSKFGVLLSGVPQSVVYDLKKRGFIPKYCTQKASESNVTLVLVLSPKLFMKILIENNFPLKTQGASSTYHVSRVYAMSLAIIERMKLTSQFCFVIHDADALSEMRKGDGIKLNLVNDYFGSSVALYFGWLQFYSNYLYIPAITGILLFCHQYFTGQTDSMWVPLFMVLLTVWGELFLAMWERRNSELTFAWGVMGQDELHISKELAKEGTIISDKSARYGLTVPIMLGVMGSLLGAMAYFMDRMDRAEEIYGADSYERYFPVAMYSTLPSVAGALCDQLAVLLNNYEGHEVQHIAHDQLIMKKFAFQFVNRYCALFYVTFYAQDMSRLRSLLIFLLITNAIVNNLYEVFGPRLIALVTALFRKSKSSTTSPSPSSAASNDASHGHSALPESDIHEFLDSTMSNQERSYWRRSVGTELGLVEVDIGDDYLEMIMQYGYCTMFAVAFPIAPVLALINNIFEAKIDFAKLLRSRKPKMLDRASIGSWSTCLHIINYASVICNCFLLCMVSDSLRYVVPLDYSHHLDNHFARILIMLFLEHCLMGLKVIMSHLVEKVPLYIQKKIAAEKMRTLNAQVEDRLKSYKLVSEENVLNSAVQADVAGREHVALKLQTEYASQFGYNPLVLMSVVLAPLVLISMGVSPYLYLPGSLLLLSYLKAKQERHDRKSAMGIVDDVNILKYVIEEMPGWVKHADVERANWLNHTLQTLWPKVSIATGDYIVNWLQPVLNSYKPVGFTSLDIAHFSLGNVAPKFAGVRYQFTEESCVRLDLELKWAGNPEIRLEVGRKSFPLTLELSDVRFSSVVRVELTPLMPAFPCFGAITVCFMKKPFMDFSFKVGALDVMNLGPADYNVASVVNSIIKSIIDGMMVYPKKLVIPMVTEVDMKKLTTPAPVGLLVLTIVGAKKLRVADMFSSDPYVEFHYMDVPYKTKTIFKTLNPTWDERFDIMVFDKESQYIDFNVWDYDMTGANDPLGTATLKFEKLPKNEIVELELDLSDTTSGSLIISCEYVELQKNKGVTAVDSEEEKAAVRDILFDMKVEDLSTDVLMSSAPPTKGPVVSTSDLSLINERHSVGAAGHHEVKSFADVAVEKMGAKFHSLRGKMTPSGRSIKPGVLTISEIRCRNIKSTSKVSNTLKPYVVFTCGSVVRRTMPQINMNDPYFTECFHIIVRDGITAELIIKVMDEYTWMDDVCIGSVKISLMDVVNSSGPVEEDYQLDVKNQEAFCACRLEWSSAAM